MLRQQCIACLNRSTVTIASQVINRHQSDSALLSDQAYPAITSIWWGIDMLMEAHHCKQRVAGLSSCPRTLVYRYIDGLSDFLSSTYRGLEQAFSDLLTIREETQTLPYLQSMKGPFLCLGCSCSV